MLSISHFTSYTHNCGYQDNTELNSYHGNTFLYCCCSVHGWDHVIQGLVHLGFLLMDSFGPRAVFGRIEESPHPLNVTPTNKACQLGSNILLNTFKVSVTYN